jgi:serine/threonine-protein kinase RsbW
MAGTAPPVKHGCQGLLLERLPARPQSITPLRQAVVGFAEACGVSERRREDIALAVSEAVSNAVLHAYVGRASEGVVTVEASLQDGRLTVVVCDDGNGMSQRDDSPGLGLGLALVERMADDLQIEDRRPGLRVRMTFSAG